MTDVKMTGWFYPIKFANGKCCSVTVNEWRAMLGCPVTGKEYDGGWVGLFLR
jgi:hypothetical protein